MANRAHSLPDPGRRRLALLLAVLGPLLILPAPARAGIKGTAHDLGAEGGACATCHLPHRALGDKLWPSDMSGKNRYGVIGALCYYCHGPGDAGGSGIISSNLGNVWDEHSHGRTVAKNPDGAAAADQKLPYVAAAVGGAFECTTCHNVHDDTNRPFLWDKIDRLCARCHPARNFVLGAASAETGEWGNSFGGNNPGSHPVGTDVFADLHGNAPVDATMAGLGILPWDAGLAGTHNLGPHLTGGAAQPGKGAGIGCNTCHAVHGIYPEGGVETPPQPDLLVIAQGAGTTGEHANGAGGKSNALCEACHRGPRPEGYAGGFWPNPGAMGFTHPVDDLDATRDLGVVALPVGWPQGANEMALLRPDLLCESCHMPHPAAAVVAQPEAPPSVPSGTSLLRNKEPEICLDCHGPDGFSSHHPTGRGLMTTAFRDPLIGNQDEDLTCDDCHGTTGAHNWPARGVPGLDPDWRPKDPSLSAAAPSDNGIIAEMRGSRFIPEKSYECFICHTNAGSHFSPTRGKAGGRRANKNIQLLGDGSHFLGPTKLDFSKGLRAGAPWSALSGTWSRGGYSLFAGTAAEPVLVCESCHELQGWRAVPEYPALLEGFRDGEPVGANPLCIGCHGRGENGANHPETGDVVTMAQDFSRAVVTLKTGGGAYDPAKNPEGTFADAVGAPTGPATYPYADGMNCDSCHQVHAAAGSTMILEADPVQLKERKPPRALTLYGPLEVPDADGTTFDYTTICVQCHAK